MIRDNGRDREIKVEKYLRLLDAIVDTGHGEGLHVQISHVHSLYSPLCLSIFTQIPSIFGNSDELLM